MKFFSKTIHSDYTKLSIFLFSFFLILFPLNKFGQVDNEELKAGIFSLFYLFRDFNFLTLTSNYIDQLGPGVGLPLGQGLFFYPTNLFIFDYKIFFNITVILNLSIQFLFFQKINKLIFKKNFFYLSLFVLFLFSNFSYLYYTDWISCFTTYTLYFPTIYYSIKFLKKKELEDYLKILLVISLIIINGHLGFGVSLIFFLFPFVVMNNQYFFLKKKFFYLGIILFFMIILERTYSLTSVYLTTKDNITAFHEGYILKDYFYLIERILYIFNKFLFYILGIDIQKEIYPPNARIPSYGIIIFVSILYSFWILFKKKSKEIYYLNLILLIFFLLTFIPHEWLFSVFSGTWVLRDILNIICFILFVKLFINAKPLIKIFLKLCLLLSLLLFVESYVFLKNNSKYKFNKVNEINQNQILDLKKLVSTNKFNKVYISPDLYDDIENLKIPELIDLNILNTKSFVKYDIYPFNTWIKNQKLNSLRDPEFKMYASIYPEYEEINNQIFLNIFRINKLLIYEKNLSKINEKIYEKIGEFKTVNKKIIILNLKEQNTVLINNNSIDQIKNHNCGLYNSILCLIKKDFFFEANVVNFKRLKNLNYEITNTSNKEINYILPIISGNYWNEKNKIFSINPDFHVIKLQPYEKIILKYENYNFLIIRIISIFGLLFTFIMIFFLKYKVKWQK